MTEDKEPLPLISGKGIDAVAPQVGAEGNGVGPQLLKTGLGIGSGGAADVAALGIKNDRDLSRDQRQGLAQ